MPLPSTLQEWNNTNSASSFAVYHHCAWWCFVNNKVHWISTWSREYEFRKLFWISHRALSTCCLSPPTYCIGFSTSNTVNHHCAWWCFVNNKVHWISTWSGEYEFKKLFCISQWALSTCCLSPPNYQNWTLCSVSGFLPSSRCWWQFFWSKSQFLQQNHVHNQYLFSHTIQDTSKAVCNTKRCTEPQTGFAPVPSTNLKESAMSTDDS